MLVCAQAYYEATQDVGQSVKQVRATHSRAENSAATTPHRLSALLVCLPRRASRRVCSTSLKPATAIRVRWARLSTTPR